MPLSLELSSKHSTAKPGKGKARQALQGGLNPQYCAASIRERSSGISSSGKAVIWKIIAWSWCVKIYLQFITCSALIMVEVHRTEELRTTLLTWQLQNCKDCMKYSLWGQDYFNHQKLVKVFTDLLILQHALSTGEKVFTTVLYSATDGLITFQGQKMRS